MNDDIFFCDDEVAIQYVITMFLADVPVAEIATRADLFEADVIEILRDVLKDELLTPQ
jgi:hypothetical protein